MNSSDSGSMWIPVNVGALCLGRRDADKVQSDSDKKLQDAVREVADWGTSRA